MAVHELILLLCEIARDKWCSYWEHDPRPVTCHDDRRRRPASWLPPLFEVVIARKEEPDEADNALSAFLTHLSRPS